MFDLFRRLTWGVDYFKHKHPKALDMITIVMAVGLCLFMLIMQIHKLIGT
jgi:hypothetical protein